MHSKGDETYVWCGFVATKSTDKLIIRFYMNQNYIMAPEYVLERPTYFHLLKWKCQYIYWGHSAGKQLFAEKGKGALLEPKLKTKWHCTFMTEKASGIHGWIRQRIASRSREMDPHSQGLLSTGKATPGVLCPGLGPQ